MCTLSDTPKNISRHTRSLRERAGERHREGKKERERERESGTMLHECLRGQPIPGLKALITHFFLISQDQRAFMKVIACILQECWSLLASVQCQLQRIASGAIITASVIDKMILP